MNPGDLLTRLIPASLDPSAGGRNSLPGRMVGSQIEAVPGGEADGVQAGAVHLIGRVLDDAVRAVG